MSVRTNAPRMSPAGLPSSLLERRPDIRQVEQSLIAANAQIGVAKAAYFLAISLTGSGGVQSFALASLFTGPAGFWSAAGSLVQPIFTAGRLTRLSDIRYRGGATSYLEVLTSQTDNFSAELGLAHARLNELLAMVQLYSALGGGWQP
jgi:outer membrane protein, multidrug efflux system